MKQMSSLICLAIVWTLARPAAAAPDHTPVVRRFALMAASNDGGPDRARLRFANSDAESMAKVLRVLGGVRADDLVLVTAARRASLERAFDRVRAAVEKVPSGQQRRELFVYYSGHSDEQGLLLAGERVPYEELRRWVDGVGVDVRIVVLDSCASGSMIRVRGGTRRPSFLSDVSVNARGHAFLTASSADEAAQESDRIGAGFFSHYLLSGLRGAADANRDKLVTLAEAYQFSYHETLRSTGRTAQSQHPAYDFQLTGQGDLVLTDLRSSASSLILDGDVGGHVFVRSESGQLLAELRKEPGYPVQLGLGPGKYTISVETAGAAYATSVTLRSGQSTRIGKSTLGRTPAQAAVARGVESESAVSSESPVLRDELIGEDSLAGRTRQFGGYAGLGFRYTRLGGKDAFLAGLEFALLLNRRVTLGFVAAGGASGPLDEQQNRATLGYAGAVFRYNFLFDGPFSFSLGAVAGAGATGRENDDETVARDDDALFLFEPQVVGHVLATRFLRFGVDFGYRLAAGVERYPIDEVRGPTAGFQFQAGWF
jgi:hypothetical protein